jgi:hypothetical protein
MAKLPAFLAKFEKSPKDKEPKGKGKEGSKQEEAWDKKQAKGMKCGGKVAGKAGGGIMRGTGAAVKGKKFTRAG